MTQDTTRLHRAREIREISTTLCVSVSYGAFQIVCSQFRPIYVLFSTLYFLLIQALLQSLLVTDVFTGQGAK